MYNEYEIYNENKRLEKELNANKESQIKLKSACTHRLTLLFDDHEPHKVGKIFECFCPACGRIIKLYTTPRFKNILIDNTKIIDLTQYPSCEFKKCLPMIKEYIFDNYEHFYSENTSAKDLAKEIIDLVDIDKNNLEKPKTLKKTK